MKQLACHIEYYDAEVDRKGVYLDESPGMAQRTEYGDVSVYWWTEGNGSCDCNRILLFCKDNPWDMPKCGDERMTILSITVFNEDGSVADTFTNLEDLNGSRKIRLPRPR